LDYNAAMPLIALTRPVPSSLARCELTHLPRVALDVARAGAQHAAYEQTLRWLGVEIRRVSVAPELPDSVFIEDAAVVLPEVAIVTHPGAASRRGEIAAVEAALAPLRRIARIVAPGTLDGGDVLVLQKPRLIFAGLSSRTNEAGIEQLAALTRGLGYQVIAVEMKRCLHLKSAATAISAPGEEPLLLVNAHWLPPDAFPGIRQIAIHPAEPYAANALRVGDAILHSAAFSLTRHLLHLHGVGVVPVENDELAKAEGALTCCCILLDANGGA
jgi:dimethylargininase